MKNLISVVFYISIGVGISSGDSIINGPSRDVYESVLSQLEEESSTNCRRHARDTLSHLRQFSPWAVAMYDSGGKFPRGIITSVAHHAGNHYDCVGVERIDDKGVILQGQYCVIPMEIFKRNNVKEFTNETLHHNAFDELSCSEDQCHKIRYHGWNDPQEIYWGICIPSTCSHTDLEEAMNKVLAEIGTKKSLRVHATLRAVDCVTKQNGETGEYENIFFFTIFCLCFICLASTLHDCHVLPNANIEEKKQGLLLNAFHGFSIKRNYEELVIEPLESDCLRILYGVRVISALFIIAFHRMLLTGFVPLLNPDYIKLLRTKPSVMLFRSGEMAVDTFFMISAFLHMLSLLRQKGNVSFVKQVFRRFMRLTPVALVAIFMEIIMVDKMVYYPLWKHVKHLIQRPCCQNWKFNVLYVSNFKPVDDMCLVNAWYLGADMQLFVLSIPVISLVIKYHSMAKYIFGILALLSIAVPFAVALHTGAPPILLAILDRNVHPLVRSHAENLYWPTYCRAGAYIVGLYAGFLYHKLKFRKYKFSKTLSWALMLSSFICCIGPLYYSASFHDRGYIYSSIEAALFASTNRFLWGLGVSALILNITFGAKGFLHSFLGHKIFIFLGKITYSSLLANLVINVYFLGSGMQPIYLNTSYYVTSSILDVFFTYLLGFFIYLIIEQPFRNLTELICSAFKIKCVHEKSI